jgi:di/tricarboxylate transporter
VGNTARSKPWAGSFDFFKVELPLTVLIYAVSIALVPLVWPM